MKEGAISIVHVTYEEQAENIFTKALCIEDFVRWRHKLNMIDIYVVA